MKQVEQVHMLGKAQLNLFFVFIYTWKRPPKSCRFSVVSLQTVYISVSVAEK